MRLKNTLKINGMMAAPEDLLLVDTETTGLDPSTDELLEVSVIDLTGQIRFNSLIKPEHHQNWEAAEAVNHISPEMVRNAPSFQDIKDPLREIFRGKKVFAYNMNFDGSFLHSVLEEASGLYCTMENFTRYARRSDVAECLGYELPSRWFSLRKAVQFCDPGFSYSAHRSLEDCYALRLVTDYLLHRNFTFEATGPELLACS